MTFTYLFLVDVTKRLFTKVYVVHHRVTGTYANM